MGMFRLWFAAPLVAAGAVAVTPASADVVYHRTVVTHRVVTTHHDASVRHHSRKVCKNYWSHHHKVRRCHWERW